MLNIPSGTLSRCHEYLDKMGKINKRSVQNLSQEAKDFLREVTPDRLKELAQMNCFAADKIKNELDNKYGRNNYVIISLGRSLSSICELIKQTRTKVIHLPLSDMRRNDFNQNQDKNIIMFKKYLKFAGLTQKKLEMNPNKKYILMDYTYYGRSLDKTYDFLKKPDMLGDAPNLIKLPVCDVLGKYYNQKGFKNLFEYSRFKDYAIVGKLSIKKLSNIFIQSNPETAKEYQGNITQGVRKLFWFNVFDSLKNGEYKKDLFPRLEVDALYKHYLSPKAVRNYLKKELANMNNAMGTFDKK